MTARRGFLGALLVATAVLLQTVLVSRLALPYGQPDLVVLVVVALACAAGPGVGTGVGFGAGLLLDLLGTAPLGLFALVLTLVGYAAGRLAQTAARSWVTAVGLAAGGTIAATLGYAALVALVGEARLDWLALVVMLPADAGYAVLFGLLVVPAVFALDRRLGTGTAR